MSTTSSRWVRAASKGVSAVAALAAIGLLLAWMGGAFHAKVAPGEITAEPLPAAGRELVAARRYPVEETVEVVATVQPRRQADVASQVLAAVREVYVDPGARVNVGDDLVLLDDSELVAQQREAMAALAAAQADLVVRKTEVARVKELLPKGSVTREEFDRVQAAAAIAEAQVNRSRQQVNRIEVQIGYTKIKATTPGVVADRFVEKGDLAVPGKPLLKLQDTRELELHAAVPESQALRVSVGQKLAFRVDAPDVSGEGTVREIVPLAQLATRSVLVKVTIPRDRSAPVFAGMFGRVSIPAGRSERLLVPAAAVRQVGQLETVEVEGRGGLERRFVRTGRTFDDRLAEVRTGRAMDGDLVEILTGLSPGARVALPAR